MLIDNRWDVFCRVFIEILNVLKTSERDKLDTSSKIRHINCFPLCLDEFTFAFLEIKPCVTFGPEANLNSLRIRDFLERYFYRYGNFLRQIMDCVDNSGSDPMTDISAHCLLKFDMSVTLLVNFSLASLLGAFSNVSSEAFPFLTSGSTRRDFSQLFGDTPHIVKTITKLAFINSISLGNYDSEKSVDSSSDFRNSISEDGIVLEHLMMQSLLCSPFCSAEHRIAVRKFCLDNPTILGVQSLLFCTLNDKEKVNILLQEFPSVFDNVSYLKHIFFLDNM